MGREPNEGAMRRALRRQTMPFLGLDEPGGGALPCRAWRQTVAQQRAAVVAARPVSSTAFHWPEYLIEAACLGLFMVSACMFGTLFEHPASPIRQTIDNPLLRRIPMGLAMGLTAICLIYSPLGQRSGAHMNPSTTLTFFRLGKVAGADLVGYIVAQIVGGVVGVQAASLVLQDAVNHPAVNHVATLPRPDGLGVAFVAET